MTSLHTRGLGSVFVTKISHNASRNFDDACELAASTLRKAQNWLGLDSRFKRRGSIGLKCDSQRALNESSLKVFVSKGALRVSSTMILRKTKESAPSTRLDPLTRKTLPGLRRCSSKTLEMKAPEKLQSFLSKN